MSKYLIHASFKPEGIRQVLMKGKATGLKAAVTKLAEAAGGKLEAYYFAFGQDDVIGIADMPDNVAVASVSVAAHPCDSTSHSGRNGQGNREERWASSARTSINVSKGQTSTLTSIALRGLKRPPIFTACLEIGGIPRVNAHRHLQAN